MNNKAMGNVSVRVTSAAVSTDGSTTPNLLHLFVTLQGIEAHANATAAEDSPNWEELAPELVRQPVQIDLLARTSNSCAANRVPSSIVSAGAYQQIRLRLAPNHPAMGDVMPAENACGEIGLHCAISPDAHIHPLAFVGDNNGLRVAADRISGNFLYVLPDIETHLTIEFNPFASLAAPSGDTVQLTPVFGANSAPSCNTAANPEP